MGHGVMIYCNLSVSTLVTVWLCELNFSLSIPAGLTNHSLESPATAAKPPATTAELVSQSRPTLELHPGMYSQTACMHRGNVLHVLDEIFVMNHKK